MKIVAHTMKYCGGAVFSDLETTIYNANDYDEYKLIYEDCFHEMRASLELMPVDCCDSREKLLSESTKIFILRNNTKLIGSVSIYDNEIDDLIVAKEFQNKGYGKKLLIFAVAKMQKENISPIILHVTDWNKAAINLYLKNGFTISKTEIFN